jgi:predicted O-methyltransferase YrrM
LELGTSLGYSTLWIAQALSENDADFKLITIERNTPKFNVMQKLFSTVPYVKNISFFNSEIIDVLHTIKDQSFDFIFMDADRGNYELYWPFIKNFLHKESFIVIDNAFMEKKSMHAFMEKLSADTSILTHLHPIDHGLLLVTLTEGTYNPENIISDIL